MLIACSTGAAPRPDGLGTHPPHRQRLPDGRALDDFLDIIPRGLIRLEKHMHLVDAPEEVVEVAHDVLIGAHEEDAQVVGLDLAVAVGNGGQLGSRHATGVTILAAD